jgi:glycosyltransferase involved in cell wall biosynthesis
MKSIMERHRLLCKLNKFFVSRVRGVVVEGQAQAATFAQLIAKDRIHVVPNFAEDFLFVNDTEIERKFQVLEPLRVLFLSNLIFGKGHLELVEAYISLPPEIKQKLSITFVGGFQSDSLQTEFHKLIAPEEGLVYYGRFVAGEPKRAMYCDSHIFALPTYYPYEGQPISILEAYATGCVVLATNHSGIPEVFTGGVNGYAVEKKSVLSIAEALRHAFENKETLKEIAFRNRDVARERYRTSIYCASLCKILGVPMLSHAPQP